MIAQEKMTREFLQSLGRTYMCHRYAILFYFLLFALLAVPVLDAFGSNGILIDSLLAASLLAALMPVNSGKNRRLLIPIMVAAWFARLLALWFEQRTLSIITSGIWTLIGLLAAGAALGFAFRARRVVDAEQLYAALSAYLLAGLYFGFLYWALNQLRSETFSTSGNFSRMSGIYFSFVTLATLGYGDITPRTDVARGLAIMEGVGGQLFLAVLVARLVSLYTTAKPEQ